MRRRLLTILSALSLVLCVATVVVWVRSYWQEDLFPFGDSEQLIVSGGGIELQIGYRTIPLHYDILADHWTRSTIGQNTARFAYDTQSPQGPFPGTMTVACPLWFLLAVFASLMVTWIGLRARAVKRLGRCFNCDYDLTGNTSGVCPECGTTPIKSTLL